MLAIAVPTTMPRVAPSSSVARTQASLLVGVSANQSAPKPSCSIRAAAGSSSAAVAEDQLTQTPIRPSRGRARDIEI
jgi:hypothetical protein